MLNDIIKLNDYQICYFSTSTDKKSFKLVLFTLYKNDTLMNLRYYEIEMWSTYTTKIYYELKSALYKNFISLAFSSCPQELCHSSSHLHYSSLIIFSYPNSTDISLDIIPLLYGTNKKINNDFSFNFERSITIENNLFGFVFKGTRIMNYPEGLNLTNISNQNFIEIESIILENENVSLYFETYENIGKKDYIIEYAYVFEEPDYDNIINIYVSTIDGSYGNNIESEKNYYHKNEYTGKSSYFTLKISEDLTSDCNDDSCELCFTNYTCITCIYGYTFNNQEKICTPKPVITTIIIYTTFPNTTPEQIIYSAIPTSKMEQTIYKTVPNTIIEKIPLTIPEKEITIPKTNQLIEASILYNLDLCTEIEILEGKFKGKLSSEEIKKIFDQLKQTISSDSNEIIETENVVFQLSTLEEQKNNNNPNVSSIDLGECEQLIKNQEGLSENDNLIVLKTDIKNEDLASTYVQYEIYNPISLKLISLDICSDIPISISIPIALNENTKSMYDSLYQSGYNLFDLNDSFYNDICTTYTTEDGTDLTLADRKNLIYDTNSNISMCQDGCTFQFFNTTINKVKCDCSIQKEETITDISKIKFDKKQLAESFFNTLKNSNFLVLKCYKLVFSKKGQTNNIGSYMMSAIDFIFAILIFVYIINGNKKLDFYIQTILKMKLNHNSNNRDIHYKNLEKDKNNKRIETFTKSYKKKQLKLNKNRNKKYMKKPIQTGKINIGYPPKRQVNFIILNNFKKTKDNLGNLPEKFQDKSRSNNNLVKIKKNLRILEIKKIVQI